jgi:FKBP-type peptidyl-prolyl cis-trans isomerase
MHQRISILVAALALAGCATAGSDTRPASAAATPAKAPCVATPQQIAAKDIAPGSGEPVVTGSELLVAYTGWLFEGCAPDQQGKQFDTSKNRVTPFGFVLGAGRVIKGWDEGVVGMREGGKRVLWIPADKAYGVKGTPDGSIPPNSALVFEIELLKVISRPQGAAN